MQRLLPIKILPYYQGSFYFSIFLIFAFPVPVRSPTNAASPLLPLWGFLLVNEV